MPKKGELNHKEQEQESERAFRKTRHRHSAIESNINEPEHKGIRQVSRQGLCPLQTICGFGYMRLQSASCWSRADATSQGKTT